MRQNEVIVFPNLQLRVHSQPLPSLQPLPHSQPLKHSQPLPRLQPCHYTLIQMNYFNREMRWCLGLGLQGIYYK